MSIFKDHKLSVKHLLALIPDAYLEQLSLESGVDRYAKVLHGRKMFYLLLYGILENERLSQRSLEDTFNDPFFKELFQLDASESVRRSSLSERLSSINADYFAHIYQCIYEQYADLYSAGERQKHKLIRVDSSLVSDTAGKLQTSIGHRTGKKAEKYTMAFDGLLPCSAKAFSESSCNSEEVALPRIVWQHVKQQAGHENIYVLDRGLQSVHSLQGFDEGKVSFVCRVKENRKYELLANLLKEDQPTDLGESILLSDQLVRLYSAQRIHNKKGNIHYREALLEHDFRLITVQSKQQPEQHYWLLTNELELPAGEVAQAYRRRWDIAAAARKFSFVSLNRSLT